MSELTGHLCLFWQRLSVIVTDGVLYSAAWFCTRRMSEPRRTVTFLLVVCNAGLLIVDHIHFQYNGVLLGAHSITQISSHQSPYLGQHVYNACADTLDQLIDMLQVGNMIMSAAYWNPLKQSQLCCLLLTLGEPAHSETQLTSPAFYTVQQSLADPLEMDMQASVCVYERTVNEVQPCVCCAGILLWSIGLIQEGHDLLGGLLFAVLLNMKHLFACLAPLYFVYLLRHYCRCATSQPGLSFFLIRNQGGSVDCAHCI